MGCWLPPDKGWTCLKLAEVVTLGMGTGPDVRCGFPCGVGLPSPTPSKHQSKPSSQAKLDMLPTASVPVMKPQRRCTLLNSVHPAHTQG